MQSGIYSKDYSNDNKQLDNMSSAHPLPLINDLPSALPPCNSSKPPTQNKPIIKQEELDTSKTNIPNNNVVIVNGKLQCEIIGKKFPCVVAYLVLLINLILPGIGTMIASCYITDPLLKASFCCSGCYELFMCFLIIGWCFALCHSCMFIGAAHSGMTFEEYHKTMNKRKY